MNIKKIPFLQRATCCYCNHTVYGTVEDFFDGEFAWFKTQDGKSIPVYADSIGACSGKKDKNGNFIFEGDVVKIVFEEEEGYFEGIYVVAYDFKVFGFETYKKTGKSEGLGLDYLEDVEVVGNIFDNPKLVEGWKNPEQGVKEDEKRD